MPLDVSAAALRLRPVTGSLQLRVIVVVPMSDLGVKPAFFDLAAPCISCLSRSCTSASRFLEYDVVLTIPIGYPMGNFGSLSRKSPEEVVYSERWGQRLWARPERP